MSAHIPDKPRRRLKCLRLGVVAALVSAALTLWTAVSGSILDSRQAALTFLAAVSSLLLGALSILLLREIGHGAKRETQLAEERLLLQAANARLAEERIRLHQLNVELKHSKERAEAANEAKSQFLANMSHELRTPLNAIIGFSQIIRDEAMGPVGVRQYADYANDIFCAGEHLLALINNVLDTSKIQAGKFTLKEGAVDLHEAVHGSLAAVAAQALQNKVALKLDLPPKLPAIRADAIAIRQILINLLSNAVKFTPEGGEVRIGFENRPERGCAVVIADTGIGMRESDLALALEPFRQIDNALNRRYAGTGLGLPIAQRLIELHGGRLEIASAEKIGTVIRVHIPAERLITGQAAA